jgi:DNA-binding CsgD family transcriptional regulator
MLPQTSLIAKIEPETYPLGEKNERANAVSAMAMVALSHTPVERRLYAAMLNALAAVHESSANSPETPSSNLNSQPPDRFTVRRVMELAGIASVTTIRRGLAGLVAKLSVERQPRNNGDSGNGAQDRGVAYRVFFPDEVLARREQQGIKTFTNGSESRAHQHSFERVIHRLLENRNLSRREAQVAVCCVEGLTNAEIGSRLLVTEQTVKFHMRNIFVKFGVKRRAELISRLLM